MSNDFKILLDISQEDFKASSLLYNNGFYPQALFYLQQSIEKLIKYLGLKDEVIKQDELVKKISHKSTLIFKRAMIKYQHLDDENKDADVNNDFQDLNNQIEKLPENKILDVILSKILETLKVKSLVPPNIDSEQSFEDFYNFLKRTDPNTPNLDDFIDDKSFKQIAQEMFDDFKTDLDDNIKGIAILFYINIITERLVSSVRYPDINNMINPSERYNSNNQLIRELPNLFKAFEFSYEVIKSR